MGKNLRTNVATFKMNDQAVGYSAIVKELQGSDVTAHEESQAFSKAIFCFSRNVRSEYKENYTERSKLPCV
jgi:hypothetical protein